MKKIILLLIVFGALKATAQDSANYVLIYKDTLRGAAVIGRTKVVNQAKTFNNLTDMNNWLNTDQGIDSTQLVGIYELRKQKPMKPTYTVEEKTVMVKEKSRKWLVK